MNYRLKMEKYLGRKLKSNEIIHHIDGDSTNDKISNLQIVTQKQHQQIHKKFKVDYQNKLKLLLKKNQLTNLKEAIKNLDIFFTKRQQELIYKKLLNKYLSKTEKEYYSRTISKKLKALANFEFYQQCQKIYFDII